MLASQSPRRRELLGQIGLDFTVQAPQLDEGQFTGLGPAELVTTLAREKAALAAVDEDTLVIAADTVVVLEGEILGKPSSPDHAAKTLAALSGRTHQVYTGLCLRRGETVTGDFVLTQVRFRQLSPQRIAQYVATGEPMDKAGAYGIQGRGALLVEEITGDYFNVVGLPLGRLGELLADFGVDPMA